MHRFGTLIAVVFTCTTLGCSHRLLPLLPQHGTQLRSSVCDTMRLRAERTDCASNRFILSTEKGDDRCAQCQPRSYAGEEKRIKMMTTLFCSDSSCTTPESTAEVLSLGLLDLSTLRTVDWSQAESETICSDQGEPLELQPFLDWTCAEDGMCPAGMVCHHQRCGFASDATEPTIVRLLDPSFLPGAVERAQGSAASTAEIIPVLGSFALLFVLSAEGLVVLVRHRNKNHRV